METFGFRDVVLALLENALDEAVAGRCSSIEVELADDAVRVADDGGGLPLHAHPRSGRPLIEVILTGPRRRLKPGAEAQALNSLARVNHACLWLEVEVRRDGETWRQRYELALPADPLERAGPADPATSGTSVTCAPAAGEAPTFDEVCQLVRESELEAGQVEVRVRDRREAREERLILQG